MKLTKQQKKDKSKELASELKDAGFLAFTNYQGLKFTELYGLRAKLKSSKSRYSVVKNSIVRHALQEAGIPLADEKLFQGPLGMVVSKSEDPSGPAKVLSQFAKEFPLLKFRAGYVRPKWLTGPDIQRLAALPSRTELLAKLAGALNGSLVNIASVLQAPMRDLALVLKALEDKKKAEAPAGSAA